MVARGIPVARDSFTDGESRLRRSWWSVQAQELGSPKNLVGKSYRWRGVLMVVVAPMRLCDDCNVIGVRHGRWMGRRPHSETRTVIFSNSSMALISFKRLTLLKAQTCRILI